jgi:hypothetical protein
MCNPSSTVAVLNALENSLYIREGDIPSLDLNSFHGNIL